MTTLYLGRAPLSIADRLLIALGEFSSLEFFYRAHPESSLAVFYARVDNVRDAECAVDCASSFMRGYVESNYRQRIAELEREIDDYQRRLAVVFDNRNEWER